MTRNRRANWPTRDTTAHRPPISVGFPAPLHNALPAMTPQFRLLPTAALAELMVGKLNSTARPAANNAANVQPKPVRTARRQPDALPEPIPKLPAKRNMALPVTASAISALMLVTNQQPLPNKAIVRQAATPARRLKKTERPAGSEDLLLNVRPATLPGWKTAAAKLTPKAGIILQMAPPADRYAVNVKPKPAPTAHPLQTLSLIHI